MDSNGTTTARKTQHRVHSPACLPSARLAARKTSGRASDLPETPCANRRRRRSQIPGWAQGVKGHPRLVPKRSKESRKASNALQTGPRKANDATKSTQFALPPSFGEGPQLSPTRAVLFPAMCTPLASKLKTTRTRVNFRIVRGKINEKLLRIFRKLH